MPIALEICVESVESALAAESGGADRVELCCALREGGLTPSAGLIHAVRASVKLDVYVLIRPRGGDFHYSEHDFRVMQDDIRRARDLGADGVVLAVLDDSGKIDVRRTAALVDQARPMKVTFNRAFDTVPDLDQALDDVVKTGADRILTSGGKRLGMHGVAKLADLVKAASGRITILGAGGIRHSNAPEFVKATGVTELHTSLRRNPESGAQAQKTDAILGTELSGSAQYIVSANDVKQLRLAVQAASPVH